MLTGSWPFRGKTAIDVRHAVLHDAPLPLAQARASITPPRLQEILDKALAKEPRARYQRVIELGDDLRQVLHELTPGTVSQFDEVTPLMAPRHMGGKGPMARALRWFKSKTGSDGSGASTVPLRKEIHETPGTSLGETSAGASPFFPFVTSATIPR